MRVSEMPRTANSLSSSSSAPVRSPTTATSDVLSLPVGAGSWPGGATSTNRVTAPGVVGDVVDQGREAVPLGGDRRADGGVELPGRDRRGGRRRSTSTGSGEIAGQVRREPAGRSAPGRADGWPPSGRRTARRRAARPASNVTGEEDLAGDHQRVAVGQPVHRGGHRTLDGVLQRDQRGVGVTRPDGGQRGGDTRLGVPGSLRGGNGAAERGFGEGTLGPEIGEPRRRRLQASDEGSAGGSGRVLRPGGSCLATGRPGPRGRTTP